MPLILLPLLLALALPATAADLAGRVSHVVSGRQLVLITETQGRHPLRLQGIRLAMEQPPLMRAARDRVNGLIGGRFVRFQASGLREEGEPLGFLDYAGQEVNLTLVADGLAIPVPEQLDPRRLPLYEQAQRAAQQRQVGLWAPPRPDRKLLPQ